VIKTTHFGRKSALLAAAAPLSLALIATPAFAQDATQAAPAVAPAPDQADQADQSAPSKDIVVTGTLFRNASAATASPVTVLSSTDLANRGINTVSDAIQQLSANNGGTLNSNWSQVGFPKGASAASLRGLDDGRTLTLFDGLRSAPYALADDGYRNFVDTNTIPDSIVDRVEVLQDGASSTYGADAVAGVVNIIVKKEITGLHANVEAGISQRGDAAEQRADLTYGIGKLSEQGYNFYINGEYQNDSPLFLRDRPGPSGTSDHSNQCASSVLDGTITCRSNAVVNGIQADGSYGGFGETTVPFVRPVDATSGSYLGNYQLLNPAAGCGNLRSQTLSAGQLGTNDSGAPNTVCQQDMTNQYAQLNSKIRRFGANAHAEVNIGSRAKAYAMFNFYETETWNPGEGGPLPYGDQTAPASLPPFAISDPVLLPAYVCPLNGANAVYTGGIASVPGGCTAGTAGAKLNPNNPFAASGQLAALGALIPEDTEDDTIAQTFRYTAGISGSFGHDWNYALDATHSEVHLKYTSKGYINAQDLLNAIADGSYNFANPTQGMMDSIAPTVVNNSVSRLTLVQGSLTHGFFTLPGGDLQLAVGASYRKESINNPSSNPENAANPADRFYGINAVGVFGSRDVKSAYFELDAPIFTQLDLNASGRYDDYSSGQSNFSPKIEAQFKPIEQVKLRATYSKGFAIPSFNEAYGLPTTGYVNTQVTNQSFIDAHHGDSYATNDYSYGLTSIGNPSLKPEKSTSYTLGVVLTPLHWLTITADYYNITVKNLITTPNCDAAVDQYYANNGVTNVAGCATSAALPDKTYPDALPLLGFITSEYVNANKLKTHGMDFTVDAQLSLGHGIHLDSNFNATWLMYMAKYDADGTIERYDGTLGPCEITSCSGSPKLKGSWQNTLDFSGKATLSATVNYTSGYRQEGADDGGVYNDCLDSFGAEVRTYLDGATPVQCHTPHFVTVDMTASIKVADRLTFYTNVLNLLDAKAPFDPAAGYGIYQFNPAWASSGFIGRYFRFGAKLDF
jgi:iron complex outermembrane receptor protein